MPQPGDVYLGKTGQEMLLPRVGRTVTESDFIIEKEDRVASGRMVRDIVTTKKKFKINYEGMYSDDLLQLIGLYDLLENLNLKIYRSNGSVNTYTVKLEPFGRKWINAVEDDWFYGDISVELEEI